jgi:putative phage-type endonuclease
VLTDEQIALRRTGITATDVAAIVGLNPFRGPLDVYLDKVGRGPEDRDSEAMRWGRELEPVILRRYAEDLGVEIAVPGTLRHLRHPELLGTPDGLVVGQRRGVEVKTAGLKAAAAWGEAEHGSVPPAYLVQCAMYMAICDADVWDLAVLIGGQDYRVYEIERDVELETWLVDSALRFWNHHVLTETPPPVDGRYSTSRYLAREYPTNNGVLRGSDLEIELLAERLKEAREAVAIARAAELEAENRLKALIGESDGVQGSFFTIYWRRSRDSRDVDYAALLEELSADEELRARIDELKARHTRQRAGSRTFRPYFKPRVA